MEQWIGSVHSKMAWRTHFFFIWRLSRFGKELFIYSFNFTFSQTQFGFSSYYRALFDISFFFTTEVKMHSAVFEHCKCTTVYVIRCHFGLYHVYIQVYSHIKVFYRIKVFYVRTLSLVLNANYKASYLSSGRILVVKASERQLGSAPRWRVLQGHWHGSKSESNPLSCQADCHHAGEHQRPTSAH